MKVVSVTVPVPEMAPEFIVTELAENVVEVKVTTVPVIVMEIPMVVASIVAVVPVPENTRAPVPVGAVLSHVEGPLNVAVQPVNTIEAETSLVKFPMETAVTALPKIPELMKTELVVVSERPVAVALKVPRLWSVAELKSMLPADQRLVAPEDTWMATLVMACDPVPLMGRVEDTLRVEPALAPLIVEAPFQVRVLTVTAPEMLRRPPVMVKVPPKVPAGSTIDPVWHVTDPVLDKDAKATTAAALLTVKLPLFVNVTEDDMLKVADRVAWNEPTLLNVPEPAELVMLRAEGPDAVTVPLFVKVPLLLI